MDKQRKCRVKETYLGLEDRHGDVGQVAKHVWISAAIGDASPALFGL